MQNANAVIEWEITDLTRKEAETEAFEAARNANDVKNAVFAQNGKLPKEMFEQIVYSIKISVNF